MKDSSQGAENHTETWSPTASKAKVEKKILPENLDESLPWKTLKRAKVH